MSRILDFIRATKNFQKRGTMIRVSPAAPKSDDTVTILTKKDLRSGFQKAMSMAGASARVELCRKDKAGQLKTIAAYREVKLGEDTGIFLD